MFRSDPYRTPQPEISELGLETGTLLPGKAVILLVLIMSAAICFRFAALDRIPPGVFSDEALNGNEGIDAQRTSNFKIFYPNNNGREGLWINLIGIFEFFFGVNQFGLRFCSALAGSLTVLFVYLLARELLSVGAALFSAWFLATGFWHVVFSRIAFRAILVPLFFSASLYLLVRAVRAGDAARVASSALLAALGGVIYGLGFHTYIAYRFTPIAVAAFFVLDLQKRRTLAQPVRPWLRIFMIWLFTAVTVALPMGLYFLRHPADFTARAKQVSIFAQPNPLKVFWDGLIGTMGMFNIRGDCAWFNNIGCSPELLLPVGIVFAIGIGLSLRNVIRDRVLAHSHCLLLAWFLVMLLPALLTGGPSALRSIGAVPPVFIFAGIGAEWIFAKLGTRRIACCVFLLALIATGAIEAHRYFNLWARDPQVRYEFDAPKVEIGRFLNSLPPGTPRYVVVDRDDDDVPIPYKDPNGSEKLLPISVQTIMFETHGHSSPTYLFEDEVAERNFSHGSVIVQLYASQEFFSNLKGAGLRLRIGNARGIAYATVE